MLSKITKTHWVVGSAAEQLFQSKKKRATRTRSAVGHSSSFPKCWAEFSFTIHYRQFLSHPSTNLSPKKNWQSLKGGIWRHEQRWEPHSPPSLTNTTSSQVSDCYATLTFTKLNSNNLLSYNIFIFTWSKPGKKPLSFPRPSKMYHETLPGPCRHFTTDTIDF